MGLAAFALTCAGAALPSQAQAQVPWEAQGEGVATEEIRVERAGATLVGTLSLPVQGERLPAVVAFHSASEGDRGYALYRHLSEGLPAQGVAALVFDRRGDGASGGSRGETDYAGLAEDGLAFFDALARHPRIDPARIGVWGLSQGGWLAAIAASRSPEVAFAVSVSAPMTTPGEQMRFAVANILRVNGYDEAAVRMATDARRRWSAYLRGETARADAEAALARAQRQPWFERAYLPTPERLPEDPAQDAWTTDMDMDPRPMVVGVRVPMLIVYGTADPWVPVAESVAALGPLLRDRPNVELRLIDGADHMMARSVDETMATDEATLRVQAPDVPAYFLVLADWLRRHAFAPASERRP